MASILEKTTGLVAFCQDCRCRLFQCRQAGSSAPANPRSRKVSRDWNTDWGRAVDPNGRRETLSLTTEGQAYYERVAPLLRAIEDAEDVVQAASDAKGLLRVSAPQEFRANAHCGRGLRKFLARHPGVKLELNVTDRNVDVIREGYDLAVRMGTLPDNRTE